jgi:hypothetical protein
MSPVRHPRIRWGWVALVSVPAVVVGTFWLAGSDRVEHATPWLIAAGAIAAVAFLWAQRGVRPSVWTVVTAGAAGFYYGWVLVWLDAPWYVKALLLVAGGFLMSIANAAVRADARRNQRRRDVFATRILAAVRDSAAAVAPFALYLRPFASTDRLPAQPIPSELAGAGDFPVHLDVESLLARALRKECPLVALGREAEMQEGAGRAAVADEEWREAIVRLAERAVFEVLVPSAHPGTLWELERLVREESLDRTLFLMPEQLREAPSGVWVTTESDRIFDAGVRSYSAEQHVYDVVADWAAVSAHAERLGIRPPPYAPAGALFVLDPSSGDVARSAPLALSVLTRRSWYLRAAIRHLGLLPSADADGTDVLDTFATAVSHRGRTLEYALVLAADLYLTWSDTDTAAELMRRAVAAGGRRRRFSRGYGENLESAAAGLAAGGDEATAAACLELAAIARR